MDANAGFASIVKDNCPNPKIALDSYHVVANFNRIIDIIRCREVAKTIGDAKGEPKDPSISYVFRDLK